MAVTAQAYGNGLVHLADADIDWVADTIKVSLHTVAYVPNVDTDDFHNDATNEVSGTGYTAGGVALANKTATVVGASNETRLDADDAVWTGLDLTTAARIAVIYKDRGGASSADELIGFVNLDVDRDPAGGNLTIQWAADGILKFTY